MWSSELFHILKYIVQSPSSPVLDVVQFFHEQRFSEIISCCPELRGTYLIIIYNMSILIQYLLLQKNISVCGCQCWSLFSQSGVHLTCWWPACGRPSGWWSSVCSPSGTPSSCSSAPPWFRVWPPPSGCPMMLCSVFPAGSGFLRAAQSPPGEKTLTWLPPVSYLNRFSEQKRIRQICTLADRVMAGISE